MVYTSSPLTRPLEVTGPLKATLYAATDARDTDWYIMLLDVFPDGRAERVQDGVARARFRHGFEHSVLVTPGPDVHAVGSLWRGTHWPASHCIVAVQ